MRLGKFLSNVAVAIPDASIVQSLPAKQAPLLPGFARRPEFKIIIVWIGDVEFTCKSDEQRVCASANEGTMENGSLRLTFGVGDLGKVEVDGNRRIGLGRRMAHEDELPAGIQRNGDDGADSDGVLEDVL